MLLNLPATALAKAGPQVLQVQSTGGTSKYTVTISNAAPQIATSPALSVRVGGTGPNPQLLLNGGLFYSDTKANLGSGGAQIQSQTATTLTLNVPNLEVPSTTVSVTNETPGGGTSNQVPVTILEGDVNTLTLTRGSAIFNPLAHTYTQSFSIGYKGQRTMQGTVAVEFQLPHGVQLVSSNLIMNGLPTQLVKVNMLKGGTTNFVAVFKTNQTTLPNFTTSMAIEN